MADGTEPRLIRAAGAVVWRSGHAGTEIVLVHRPRYDDWSYPKGKRERGEHVLRTAIREVREETGHGVVLGRTLSPSVYPTTAGTKHVSYWAARHVQSRAFTPNDEVDEVLWLPAATAHERLTYERDVALLGEFRSGPAGTKPLILLRHAAAGSRAPVAGDDAAAAAADLARPLDASGEADAKILAELLTSYGECQVISSAAERCVATVRPYAEAMGVPIQVEPAFTVTPGPIPRPCPLPASQRSCPAAGFTAGPGRRAGDEPGGVGRADTHLRAPREPALADRCGLQGPGGRPAPGPAPREGRVLGAPVGGRRARVR